MSIPYITTFLADTDKILFGHCYQSLLSLTLAEGIFLDEDQPLFSLSSTALQFQQLPISVFENNDIVNYSEIFIMAHRHP